MRFQGILGLLLSVGMLFGCDEQPVQEMAGAKDALNTAGRAEAAVYAPEAFKAAEDTLNAVLAEIGRQDAKWFKNYDAARASLARVEQMSQSAIERAEEVKTALRQEAQSTVGRTGEMLAVVRNELINAPRGKGATEDLDRLETEVGLLEQQLDRVKATLSGGKLKQAVEEARHAETGAVQLQEAVKMAQQKIEMRKQQRTGRHRG